MTLPLDEIERLTALCQQGNPVPWMEAFLRVKSKDNQFVPFRLGRVTRTIADNLWPRMVVLKPRQAWVTTFFQAMAYAFACCIPGFTAGVVLHEETAAERTFQRIRMFYEGMDEALRPELSHDRTDLMEFKHSKSVIYIGTSRGFDFGRSSTLNMLVLSEFAHYQEHDAAGAVDAALHAVPTNSWAIVESTPKGIGNRFHKLYTMVKGGHPVWRAVFAPWFYHEEYVLGPDHPYVPDTERGAFAPTPQELDLMLRHGLTHDQLRWRRYKIRELEATGQAEEFGQNYPEDDVSCWLSSQEAAFPQDILQRMYLECRPPVSQEGPVARWKMPDPGTRYIMFCDCSEGLPGGDEQYAVVLSAVTGEQVARVRGNMLQDEFARYCDQVGREYYNALIAPERNNAGLFIDVLKNRLHYPNIYRHGETEEAREGFPTTVTTKPKMVAAMVSALRSGEFRSYDEVVVRQLMEYRKVRDKNGLLTGYGAPEGQHDDGAMAAMGANLLRMTMPQAALHSLPRQVGYYRSSW